MPVEIFCNVTEINNLPKRLLDLFDDYSTRKIELSLQNVGYRQFYSTREAEYYGDKVSTLILVKLSFKVGIICIHYLLSLFGNEYILNFVLFNFNTFGLY